MSFTQFKNKYNIINPVLISFTLLAIFIILPLLTYKYVFPGGDMGELVDNAFRAYKGELPYRDFWLLFTPGEVFLPALIYKIFGVNINILFIFFNIVSAFIGFTTFYLGRLILKDNFFSTILALLIFFNGITANYQGFSYIHIYFLFLLIATMFLSKFIEIKKTYLLFLSGIFVGISVFFRLYETAPMFIAAFIIIILNSAREKKPAKDILKVLSIFIAGAALVIAIFSISLWNIWVKMFKEVVFESLSHGTSMKTPYFFTVMNNWKLFLYIYAKQVLRQGILSSSWKVIYGIGGWLNALIYNILPFILIICAGWYYIQFKFRSKNALWILYFFIWGIVTFPKSFGRPDMGHLAYALTPLMMALIVMLFEIDFRNKVKFNFQIVIKSILSICMVFLLLSIPIFIIDSVVLLLKPKAEVKTEAGAFYMTNIGEAQDINSVIKFIKNNSKDGDYIFVTPWYSPAFYALTNRKNPTYYDSLIDLVARPNAAKQEKLCNDLLSKNTKIVIHYYAWGFDNKMRERQFQNTCPIIKYYIFNNYELVQRYGHYWIFRLREKNLS